MVPDLHRPVGYRKGRKRKAVGRAEFGLLKEINMGVIFYDEVFKQEFTTIFDDGIDVERNNFKIH